MGAGELRGVAPSLGDEAQRHIGVYSSEGVPERRLKWITQAGQRGQAGLCTASRDLQGGQQSLRLGS